MTALSTQCLLSIKVVILERTGTRGKEEGPEGKKRDQRERRGTRGKEEGPEGKKRDQRERRGTRGKEELTALKCNKVISYK